MSAADLRTGVDIAQGAELDRAMRMLWDTIEKLAFQLEDLAVWNTNRLLKETFSFDTHLVRHIDEEVGNAL